MRFSTAPAATCLMGQTYAFPPLTRKIAQRDPASMLTLWLPALLGIAVICTESTRMMGSDHTIVWLYRMCSFLHATRWDLPELNRGLRETGHLFGYGTLGMVFTRVWLSVLPTRFDLRWMRLRVVAAFAGILTTTVVASLDELHQHFLPNRYGSVHDVLLDTLGAMLLVSMMTTLATLRHTAKTPTPESRSRDRFNGCLPRSCSSGR